MLKAKALKAVDIHGLVAKKQNMVIESYGEDEAVRECMIRLAVLLMAEDSLIKGYILKLRQQYRQETKSFCFSIARWNETEKNKLRDIFSKEFCGIVDSVDVTSDPDMISGNLVLSSKARVFLEGNYMEIGVYEIIKNVMEEIAKEYKVSWKMYRNVQVATWDGVRKNEFDTVIECNGIYYVVEVKSGKNFRDWDSLVETGRRYNVVPGRLLMIDSWLSDEKVLRIEERCKYYVSNLKKDTLREKIYRMITSDL